MPSQPRTLFLTGAPDQASLDWDPASLLKDFTAPVARFAGLSPSGSYAIKLISSSVELEHASWRSLGLDRSHLSTGHSQVNAWVEEYQGSADFFNTSDLSFASSSSALHTFQLLGDQGSSSESIEDVLSQFYEHSFALHNNSQSTISQIKQPSFRSDSEIGTSFCINGTSFASNTESFSSTGSQLDTSETRPAIPIGVNITDLKDIPDAKFIDSIQPQTLTVNLIVGIISAAPPRGIKTRRGVDVELVELLVGDESKSGFNVNFWLSGSKVKNGGQPMDDFTNDLLALRPQDIVLLQNVAASTFRGKVYGQSLRKEMTKFHLLYRNRVDKSDVGGYFKVKDFDIGQDFHPNLTKTMQVREWVLRFVAPGASRKAGTDEAKTINESLPLDTQ